MNKKADPKISESAFDFDITYILHLKSNHVISEVSSFSRR